MRLKSLEIKGFKSFADKTVINFDEGITGIIGPNGCGKSNIVDSIRWVIGEHKISNLRSENLESLVFNGSKTRGPSGLAEVSLTFDNTKNLLPTEFNTVTVTRKFYKSGESEYRLNDVQCRLKDIHNLFLDTGISTDSYAIIELAMVDDIIKDKENSRRKMLEQAAGISIYKTRKKEAKLKLDATEQDLARIEDLLFEIHNQLKMLESQAKKAEKYYEIKKEYKVSSIELAKAALEGFNVQYKELTEQQQQDSDRKIEIETKIAHAEAELEKQKLKFIEEEKSLQQLQQAFNELINQIRTKENEKNLADQQLKYLKEKETSLNDFLSKAGGQSAGLEESIRFTHVQIAEEEAKLSELQQRIDGLKTQVDQNRQAFDEKRILVDELRRKNQQVQRNQFEAEKNVAIRDTSLANLDKSIAQLKEEHVVRQAQLSDLAVQRDENTSALNTEKQNLISLQQQHEETKLQILDTQSKLEGLRSHLAEESRKLDSKKNEYALLKSLVDSMEGYPESVKFLHKNTGWNHTAPILSDIIYVKEEFRTAVENVLEPYLNFYVVNNLQEGLQAIRLLDENKKGKANFFLLDKLDAEFGSKELHAQVSPGTISATSIVEYDAQHENLVKYLLGNVLIAEDESALENSNGSIVLERHGKYVKGKYSLTGGSVGLFEGKKIGRAKNLEKLAEEITEQDSIVAVIKNDIQARHNEVLEYNNQLKEKFINESQQKIQQLSNQSFSVQTKIDGLHSAETNSSNRLTDFEQQLTQGRESMQEFKISLDQFNQELSALAASIEAVEADYSVAELAYNSINSQYNEANLSLAKQQSKLAAANQEAIFKKNQLDELKSQIDTSNTQLSEATVTIQETIAHLKTAEGELLAFYRRKEDEGRLLNDADQAYYLLRNTLSERESELRHQVKDKEQIDQLLGLIKDKINELRLQLAGIKERLNVEFKVDIDQILDEPRQTEETLEQLQMDCDRMKKRLENIGEVNPTAIEAFQEMKKRYDFILEQKNDLVDAKNSLAQTIQEVEATANQKFLTTFNQVRENFQRVFKALFTEEDTADMVLVNPDNLADTAIDILAKPKGKRPASIAQLSGGEKTLTATALLFAIYLIKPAPFCILDEVDAPLDDANVFKFTNMIRQFSKESQFIMVTHNKTTMATVDVIYGVTMQEQGVSKLVSVDFRNLN
ncbi:MAG: chromosome segregation protein SMC [Chitinophagaceae bacterium]|nr:MAG: chromosome segregation protein SMC [Chitinophagaceae bacterium]